MNELERIILLKRIYSFCENYDGDPNPLETIMDMIEEAEYEAEDDA